MNGILRRKIWTEKHEQREDDVKTQEASQVKNEAET